MWYLHVDSYTVNGDCRGCHFTEQLLRARSGPCICLLLDAHSSPVMEVSPVGNQGAGWQVTCPREPILALHAEPPSASYRDRTRDCVSGPPSRLRLCASAMVETRCESLMWLLFLAWRDLMAVILHSLAPVYPPSPATNGRSRLSGPDVMNWTQG